MSEDISRPLTRSMYPNGRINSKVTSTVSMMAERFFENLTRNLLYWLYVAIDINIDRNRAGRNGANNQPRPTIDSINSATINPRSNVVSPLSFILSPKKVTQIARI
jgi:hypothetical protein